MTKNEKVELLKKSIPEWNQWWLKNSWAKIYLSGVNLSGANLSGAILQEADLSGADLSGADLRRAILIGADFQEADLQEANLLKANLHDTNLWRANLSRANLSRANLSAANLREANLDTADLSYANLCYAIFFCAILREANLSGAILYYAILLEADLRRANLHRADLSYANIHRADLSSADLREANLSGANLSGANLSYLKFMGTILANVNAEGAKGLNLIDHAGPSHVSKSTFVRNKGNLPRLFLEGVGLSKWEIEAIRLYDPAISSKDVTDIIYKIDQYRNENPIQIHNLFISYAHKDSEFVDALEPKLKKMNIRFWRDKHDAPAGPLDKVLGRAIKQNPTVILILSENSINSDWVAFEIEKARELEKKLKRNVFCPIRLDDSFFEDDWMSVPAEIKTQLKRYIITDFSKWKDDGFLETQFSKLIKGLNLFYTKE